MSGECGIAFKEWSAVCAALADGRQSIILRKGGIAEDDGEFKPEHPRFWLFPTWLHQHEQGVQPGSDRIEHQLSSDGSLRFQYLASVERVFRVNNLPALLDLDAFHIWTPETVEKRFRYREPGIFLLVVGVAALPFPVERINHPEYDGCKTWVHLKEAVGLSDMRPVLPDTVVRQKVLEIESILNGKINV